MLQAGVILCNIVLAILGMNDLIEYLKILIDWSGGGTMILQLNLQFLTKWYEECWNYESH